MKVAGLYSFQEGDVLDTAKLDYNFAKLAEVVNGNLARDNFRRSAGLRRDQLACPYSVFPLVFSMPAMEFAGDAGAPKTRTFSGVLALPHYFQHRTDSTRDGIVEASSALATPVKLLGYQGLARGAVGLLGGDSVKLTVKYRGVLSPTVLSGGTLTLPVDHTMVEYTFAPVPEVDHIAAQIEITTGVGAGLRSWKNISCIVWTLAPHVP